jgi:hypothetical protein
MEPASIGNDPLTETLKRIKRNDTSRHAFFIGMEKLNEINVGA